MELAWPWALLLLPIIFIPWLTKSTVTDRFAIRFPNSNVWQNPNPSFKKQSKKIWLIAIWLLLVLALARPFNWGEPVPLSQPGRDLMLIIDLSGSMKEADMVWQGQYYRRIDAVKLAVLDFIKQRQGDRLGLVVFGDEAFVQAPISQDTQAIGELLLELEAGMAGQSTAIGNGLALTVKRLAESDNADKVAILLTDGQEQGGTISTDKALEIAKKAGVRIHSIGFGSASPFMPSFDERSLKKVAAQTGGEYFKANNIAQLAQVYAKLNEIEAIEKEQQFVRPKLEWYGYFLFAALGLFLLNLLINQLGRRGGRA